MVLKLRLKKALIECLYVIFKIVLFAEFVGFMDQIEAV